MGHTNNNIIYKHIMFKNNFYEIWKKSKYWENKP